MLLFAAAAAAAIAVACRTGDRANRPRASATAHAPGDNPFASASATTSVTPTASDTPAPSATPMATGAPGWRLADAIAWSHTGEISDRLPWEMHRWDERPRVVLVGFRSRALQGETLNRVAAYVEKKGVRGTVMGDVALAEFIMSTGATPDRFYIGHDYRSTALAAFYNAAEAAKIELNAREVALRTELLALGTIRRAGSPLRWEGTDDAVISWCGADMPAVRLTVIAHEARHGIYFTNPTFARKVAAVWADQDESTRAAIRALLAAMHYDPDWEDLMINEFQAYFRTDAAFEAAIEHMASISDAAKTEWKAFMERSPGVIHAARKALLAIDTDTDGFDSVTSEKP
jgi:hypothetical protein